MGIGLVNTIYVMLILIFIYVIYICSTCNTYYVYERYINKNSQYVFIKFPFESIFTSYSPVFTIKELSVITLGIRNYCRSRHFHYYNTLRIVNHLQLRLDQFFTDPGPYMNFPNHPTPQINNTAT